MLDAFHSSLAVTTPRDTRSQPAAHPRARAARAALLAGASLFGGFASLLANNAAAQSCPSDPQVSSIVSVRCNVAGAPTGGVQSQPCKPAAGQPVVMDADKRTVELGICSKSLGRIVNARVVLPRSYYVASNPRAPTLYLLHGANVNLNIVEERSFRDWTGNTDVEEKVTANTNTFVVTPEGGPIGWWSDWQRPATAVVNWLPTAWRENWESHFFDEVIPLVDAAFPNNGQRVIAGLSMGGLGAVSFAARAKKYHNDKYKFRAVASFSGALSVYAAPNYLIPQGSLTAKLQDPNILWGDRNSSYTTWAQHDPKLLVDELVDLPVWVASGNGSGSDPVEAGAWAMSTDYANAQDAAIVRARYNAKAANKPQPTGYVVRDMVNVINGINNGCPGKHDWDNWPVALKRAWPFLRTHLLAAGSTVPPAPIVPSCGVIPTSF